MNICHSSADLHYKQIQIPTPQTVLSAVTGQPKDICSAGEMTPNLPVLLIFVLKPICSCNHSTGLITVQFCAALPRPGSISAKETPWSSFLKNLHKFKLKDSNNRCLIFTRSTHGFTASLQCIPDIIYTLIKCLIPLLSPATLHPLF